MSKYDRKMNKAQKYLEEAEKARLKAEDNAEAAAIYANNVERYGKAEELFLEKGNKADARICQKLGDKDAKRAQKAKEDAQGYTEDARADVFKSVKKGGKALNPSHKLLTGALAVLGAGAITATTLAMASGIIHNDNASQYIKDSKLFGLGTYTDIKEVSESADEVGAYLNENLGPVLDTVEGIVEPVAESAIDKAKEVGEDVVDALTPKIEVTVQLDTDSMEK